MARDISKIYIHCSASSWGCENTINHWHRLRRFGTMVDGYNIATGYHRVILNGKPYSDKDYYSYLDGSIEVARSWDTQGAGVKGDNERSYHICLIGEAGNFSADQVRSLFKCLAYYVRQKGIPVENIWGHYEYWTKRDLEPYKTCPGLEMGKLRADLKEYLRTGQVPHQEKVVLEIQRTTLHRFLDALTRSLGGKVER